MDKEEDGVKFTPSVCLQRYQAVYDMLLKCQRYLKTVSDKYKSDIEGFL